MRTRTQALWTHGTVVAMIATTLVLLALAILLGEPAWAWLLLLLPIPLAPFVEFGLHKYVLHAKRASNRARLDAHHAHHADPGRIDQLFFQAGFLALFGPAVYLLYCAVFGWRVALVPMSTSVAYFVFYEWMHFSHHDPDYRPRTRYGRLLRQSHMHHHYYNHDYWWGITNDLADRLLHTGGGRHFPKPPRGDARHLP